MKEKFRAVLFLWPFTVFEVLYIKILHLYSPVTLYALFVTVDKGEASDFKTF